MHKKKGLLLSLPVKIMKKNFPDEYLAKLQAGRWLSYVFCEPGHNPAKR